MSKKTQTRAGFVAIMGAPNVGKSTSVNQFVGNKISIISPKAQTTRTRVLGISIRNQSQIIFVDTPGIFQPKRRLDRAMVASAWSSTGDSNEIILLIDSLHGLTPDTKTIIDRLKEKNIKALLVLNKIDLIQKEKLLKLADDLNKIGVFSETFMISALKNEGLDTVLSYLELRMPPSPWLFPKDQISDMPERMLASEITRETLYHKLHQELPYATMVETESWEIKKDGSIKINQIIMVERQSQKAIVLGKNGRQIKVIGKVARTELEVVFQKRVHLFLFVKVEERWGEEAERYKAWGLNFDA